LPGRPRQAEKDFHQAEHLAAGKVEFVAKGPLKPRLKHHLSGDNE
jgi:hypothetical protein